MITKPSKFVVLEDHKEVWLRGSFTTGMAIQAGAFRDHFPGYTVRMCLGFELDRLAVDPTIRDRWSK